VRPRRLNRIRSQEYAGGYPLRRTLLLMFDRDGQGIVAQIREVSAAFGLRGEGYDIESAIDDFERRFERAIRENVRLPPHAKTDATQRVARIINHLVDWPQFELENSSRRVLWGQLLRPATARKAAEIRWLLGPGGIKQAKAPLEGIYQRSCAHGDAGLRGRRLESLSGIHRPPGLAH
jgi:hypothetical protein